MAAARGSLAARRLRVAVALLAPAVEECAFATAPRERAQRDDVPGVGRGCRRAASSGRPRRRGTPPLALLCGRRPSTRAAGRRGARLAERRPLADAVLAGEHPPFPRATLRCRWRRWRCGRRRRACPLRRLARRRPSAPRVARRLGRSLLRRPHPPRPRRLCRGASAARGARPRRLALARAHAPLAAAARALPGTPRAHSARHGRRGRLPPRPRLRATRRRDRRRRAARRGVAACAGASAERASVDAPALLLHATERGAAVGGPELRDGTATPEGLERAPGRAAPRGGRHGPPLAAEPARGLAPGVDGTAAAGRGTQQRLSCGARGHSRSHGPASSCVGHPGMPSARPARRVPLPRQHPCPSESA
mmetsp:Transcript_34475/g.113550  ORF Transcript_34475/g.113550 Transcript_34475/m.113550 type:complete len:365 (-) Transcript_34475:59-1153(-)